MRIAIGGMSHEGTTFSPLLTDLEDLVVTRGEDLLLDDNLRQLYRQHNVEIVPTLFARGTPSGIIKKSCYQVLKNEILQKIKLAKDLDGICLTLHGAMEVEEVGDGEGDLVSSIRAVVGEDVLISVSLDLHGNLTSKLVESVDLLTAYRTAPHRDAAETRCRAASLLIHAWQNNLKPKIAWIPVPILLPGEKVITELEPAASLYAMIEEVNQVPGILDTSIMVGFAWADVPHASASVVVIAENDRDMAYEQAERLAETFWNRREAFHFDVETYPVDESIDEALSFAQKPVFISDSGDNPTAGATGDIPIFLERLLAKNVKNAVVAAIADAKAVKTCVAEGLGSKISLSIGGKLDTIHAEPLTITGRVTFLSDDSKTAVFQIDGEDSAHNGIEVILTADRRAFISPDQFEALNIDLFSRDIVVVKLGYLFPELRDIAPRSIMALSPGVSNEDIESLPFNRVRRPIYPLDRDFEWSPSRHALR